jgi:hypothetical protein
LDVTAWLGDVLVWDSLLRLPQPRGGGETSVETLLAAPTLLLYDGPVGAGPCQLKVLTRIQLEGEVDARVRVHESEIVVAEIGTTSIEVRIRAEEPALLPEQLLKTARLRELEREIAEAIRAGGRCRYADQEGFWEEFGYEDGKFIHIEGWRSPDGVRSVISDETELVKRLVAKHGQSSEDPTIALTEILERISRM